MENQTIQQLVPSGTQRLEMQRPSQKERHWINRNGGFNEGTGAITAGYL